MTSPLLTLAKLYGELDPAPTSRPVDPRLLNHCDLLYWYEAAAKMLVASSIGGESQGEKGAQTHAVEAKQRSSADIGADKKKKLACRLPENPFVVQLINRYNANQAKPQEERQSIAEMAREIAASDGCNVRWESLRKALFRHLKKWQ